MDRSIFIGVDLATSESRTACCSITEIDEHRLSASLFAEGPKPAKRDTTDLDVEQLGVAILQRAGSMANVIVAIDAPFGWPSQFIMDVWDHRPAKPRAFTAKREEYRYRETDRVVRRRLGLVPLSPSTDRIGVVALVAAALVHRLLSADAGFEVALGKLDYADRLAPKRRIIEVYPEASLASWLGLRAFRGYKKDDAIRSALVDAITSHFRRQGESLIEQPPLVNDHQVDAMIAALTAREYAQGRCASPGADIAKVVQREGWIWFPKPK